MNPKRFSAALGGLMALLLPCQPAPAATVVWNGIIDNQWTNALNWSGGLAPTNVDIAVFPPLAVTGAVTNATNATLTGLLFTGSGYTLQSASILTITNGVTNAATTGTNEVAQRIQFRSVTNTVESAGVLVLSGGIIMPTATSSVILNSLPGGRIVVSGNVSNSGDLRIVGNETELAVPQWNGSGAKRIYLESGRTVVNSAAMTNVSWNQFPGTVLGGTGTVGAVSISGTIRPGFDGVGTFTIAGPSAAVSSMSTYAVLDLDLAGSAPGQSDLLKVGPGNTLNLSGSLKLNFSFLPALGVDLVLVSGGTLGGNFLNAPDKGFYQDGIYLYAATRAVDSFSVRRVRHTATGDTLSWNNPAPVSPAWSAVGNWSPSASPKSGDALFFGPAVPAHSSNDLGPLTLASLAVAGRHGISGGTLGLLGNLTVTNNAGGASLAVTSSVHVAADLAFRAGNNSLLEFATQSELTIKPGATLTITGTGTNRMMGYMYYTGGKVLKTGTGTLELTDAAFDSLALADGDVRMLRPDGTQAFVSIGESITASNGVRLHLRSHDPYNNPLIYTRAATLRAPDIRLNGAVLGSVVVTPALRVGDAAPLIRAYTNFSGTFAGHPEGAPIYDAVSGHRYVVRYSSDGLGVDLVREIEPIRFTAITRQPDQSFRLQGIGEPNFGIVVEWSTNLTNWTQLGLRPVSDGTFTINDPTPDPTNRFYRARRQDD